MNASSIKYYITLFFQLLGFALVGVCLVTGLVQGDYTKLELYQFIGGTVLFYTGHFLRKK